MTADRIDVSGVINAVQLPEVKARPGKHSGGNRKDYSQPQGNRRRIAASGPGSLNCFAEALALHRTGKVAEAIALLRADFLQTKHKPHEALAAIWERQEAEDVAYNKSLAQRVVSLGAADAIVGDKIIDHKLTKPVEFF